MKKFFVESDSGENIEIEVLYFEAPPEFPGQVYLHAVFDQSVFEHLLKINYDNSIGCFKYIVGNQKRKFDAEVIKIKEYISEEIWVIDEEECEDLLCCVYTLHLRSSVSRC